VTSLPATPLAARIDAFAHALSATAPERDRQGGTPWEERRALRESGLLSTSIAHELGGEGLPVSDILDSVRRLATVDGSLAHVWAYHHLLLRTVELFGTPAQYERWAGETVSRRWLWGNALNPKDRRAIGVRRGNEYVVDGAKSFATGARDADVLVLSFLETPGETLRVAVLRGDAPGLRIADDWDTFGQRQTDSATVTFEGVHIPLADVLVDPGPLGNVRASLRPLIAQLSLSAIYVGIAQGALGASVDAARERDPLDEHGLALAGELRADLDAAVALAREAAAALSGALARGDAITSEERAGVALLAASSKSVATRSGLHVATRSLELAGARATSRARALDRYWRDLRVHTLHDPLAHKHVDLGRWLLSGTPPKPSFYS